MFDCVPIVFRSTWFLMSEIDFGARKQQLDFLNNQFAVRLRHFRSTWDLPVRAFNEAHPTMPCKKLGHISSIFKNNSPKNGNMNFCTPPLDAPRRELFIRTFKSAVALSVSRQTVFFVCPHRTSNPDIDEEKTWKTKSSHAVSLSIRSSKSRSCAGRIETTRE